MIAANYDIGDVIFWGGLIIAVILVGGFVVFRIRNRLLSSPNDAMSDPFGLQELRDLRNNGQISEAEYQRLRSAVIAQVKAKTTEADAESTQNSRD